MNDPKSSGRSSSRWLYLIMIVALLPIIFLRDFTPDNELRYLSIADESLQCGRWWAFTNHGLPYADKPPLYLWGVMLMKFAAGGHQMWLLALFSIIPAIVTTEVMDRWAGERLSPSLRLAAKGMLLSCGLFLGMCIVLRMDMLMTMFIVLALREFDRMLHTPGTLPLSRRLLFPLWIFLGVFAKGPMGILIPLAASSVYLLLMRRNMPLREIFPRAGRWSRYWGWTTWGVLLLLCAIWWGMVYMEGGTEYLDNLLFHQTVGRGVNSFHHKAPLWYYLASLPYTLLPWTFLIFGAVIISCVRRRREGTDTERLLLVTILSTLVLLSLISSKIQVYMLPAYPFMVYLTMLVCSRHTQSRYAALAVMVPAGLLAVAGLAAGMLWLNLPADLRRWWILAIAGVLVAGTSLVFTWLYVDRRLHKAILAMCATLLSMVCVAGFAMPEINAQLGYRGMCESAVAISKANGSAPIVGWNLKRGENIDVYLGDIPFSLLSNRDEMTAELPADAEEYIVMLPAKRLPELERVADIKERYPVGGERQLLKAKYMIVRAKPCKLKEK